MSLLSVNLSVRRPNGTQALDEARFDILPGETVALAGESGSGKTTLAYAILGLLGSPSAIISGSINFLGTDLLTIGRRQWRTLRGRRIALVPQSPLAALNPALRLRVHLEEAWLAHAKDRRREWKRHSLELFERLALPAHDEFLGRYPSQISVGQAQRVLIAMALLHRPQLVIADEPTSALDALSRIEIVNLWRSLQRDFGISTLFISHDIPTVRNLADRIFVLKSGRIVSSGTFEDLVNNPRDAYTRALIALADVFPASLAAI